MTILTVQRHSGRDNTNWRVLYEGSDSAKAHMVYEHTARNLRQGAVRKLVDGTVASEQWAPRLRTHW